MQNMMQLFLRFLREEYAARFVNMSKQLSLKDVNMQSNKLLTNFE